MGDARLTIVLGVGGGLVSLGVAMVYLPAGLIVCGVLLMVAALFLMDAGS